MVVTQRGHLRGGGGVRQPGWWQRIWRRLMPGPSAELVLAQLNRQLAVLEGARAELEAGWVQGGWWTVSSADGSPRLITGPAAAGGHPDHVDGVCLVGAMVRAGSHQAGSHQAGPHQAGSHQAGSHQAGPHQAGSRQAGPHRADAASDVGRAVDAVYDALWSERGQPDAPLPCGLPPVPPPEVRLARVRTLTQWNDQADRTRAEVLALVDSAITATIMALMSAPRPAPVNRSARLRA